jgi:hypothetical protein
MDDSRWTVLHKATLLLLLVLITHLAPSQCKSHVPTLAISAQLYSDRCTTDMYVTGGAVTGVTLAYR